MKSKLITVFTAISLLLISTSVLSQDEGGGDDYIEDSFKDISLVGATAVGGALLGLSTLSFVEEPGDHLKNIVVGAAVGIIIGVGMVAFKAASKNKGIYEESNFYLNPDKDTRFATSTRMKWHRSKHSSYNQKGAEPSVVGYQFTF